MRRLSALAFFLLLCAWVARPQPYVLGPDSQRQPGVPRGAITQHTWTSKLYPGSVRDYWIYVPAQYNPQKPACVMIFQDGGATVTDTGAWRAPIVLDNLIKKGDMPAVIGIFINPGVLPAAVSDQQQPRYNRSYEYDALGDRYARFLIEEILPEVAKQYDLSKDPNDYALLGSSSGGIAAFNAAWNRPDAFRRVLTFVGSYTNLRGADTLADLIRKTEPKPLRVFLQDGSHDQDIYGGNWFLANQEIFSALQYAGYESAFTIGTEGHNAKHGGAILPDALRWIWKEYPQPVAKSEKVIDRGVFTILEPGHDWQLLGQGYQLTADSTADKEGNVYFTDAHNNRIHKIDADGKISVWKEDSGGAHGVAFGPDGRLYAGRHERKEIIAYTPDGKESVLLHDTQMHHFALTAHNEIYFADSPNHKIWFVDSAGNKRVVNSDIDFPRLVRLSTDQSLLVAADPNTRWVWSFQRQPDGSLQNGQPFYHLEAADESAASGTGGMAFDTDGMLYVATNSGIQVCDQAGRVTAIINPPNREGAFSVFFGGSGMHWLYATDGNKIYRRPVKHSGATAWNPVKPPRPQL